MEISKFAEKHSEGKNWRSSESKAGTCNLHWLSLLGDTVRPEEQAG